MTQFKIGDVIRREWEDGTYVEREVTDIGSDGSSSATTIRSNKRFISSVIYAHVDALLRVGYKVIGNVRSTVTVDSLDYDRNEGLSDEDKSIIRKYLESQAV